MTPHDYDSMLARFAEEPSLTADLVLTRLRERNASMVEAIKALVHLFGLSLGESKKLASRHDAWRAIHAANLPLHEEAMLIATDRPDTRPRRAANRA